MKTLFSRLITVIACFFIFSAAWFCLWSISLHLVERPDMAVLLFPFGLRLGLMLQCPRGYWPVLLGAEWMLRHCCKVSDEAAFCLIQRPYISKTLLTRRISPRGSP